jgi:hypothetical protein
MKLCLPSDPVQVIHTAECHLAEIYLIKTKHCLFFFFIPQELSLLIFGTFSWFTCAVFIPETWLELVSCCLLVAGCGSAVIKSKGVCYLGVVALHMVL